MLHWHSLAELIPSSELWRRCRNVERDNGSRARRSGRPAAEKTSPRPSQSLEKAPTTAKSRIQNLIGAQEQQQPKSSEPRQPLAQQNAALTAQPPPPHSPTPPSTPKSTPGLPAQKRLTMDLLYKKSTESPPEAAEDVKCPPPALPDLSIPEGKTEGETPVAEPTPPAAPTPAPPPPPQSPQTRDTTENDAPGDDPPDPSNPFAAALKRKKKAMKATEAGADLFRDPVKESEAAWQEAVSNMADRPLIINDLDFTDMDLDDDQNPFVLARQAAINAINAAAPSSGSGPPPPPPLGAPPPPPPSLRGGFKAPPPPPGSGRAGVGPDGTKTLRLHWREATFQPPSAIHKDGAFWEKLKPPEIDAEKLGALFETKTRQDVLSTKVHTSD